MQAFRRINIDRLPQLARRLQRFVKRVKTRLPVDRVILHGSAARDDLTESSDLDIVVIGDFHGRQLDRMSLVQELVPDGLPIEAFCYTPEEFAAGVASGNPFLCEVKRRGRELFADRPAELRHRGWEREEQARMARTIRKRKRNAGRV
jgi:predicted nucleotidyltransferase